MKNSLITIDTRFPACTSIDTEAWLDRVLGSEVSLDTRAKFVAGWNMPGYMPDSEPAEFDTFEEACRYVADTLSDLAFNEEEDTEESQALAESYRDAEREFERAERRGDEGEEISEHAGQYVYWVREGESRSLEEEIGNKWLMQCEDEIKAAIEAEMGEEYEYTCVDNTYNNENDFSSNFQWQVFYPAGSSDWVYANRAYVAIEVHQGGDVRGNYGRVRLFAVDDLCDTGFLDWVLGWSVRYSDGSEVEENDRFSIGYSSNPFCELVDHIKDGESGMHWSEKRHCFVAWWNDGRAVEIAPYINV